MHYGHDEILKPSYYTTTVTLMKNFVNIPIEFQKLLLPDITMMRLLMLVKGESIDKTYLSFISQSDGFIKIFNKFLVLSISSVMCDKHYIS